MTPSAQEGQAAEETTPRRPPRKPAEAKQPEPAKPAPKPKPKPAAASKEEPAAETQAPTERAEQMIDQTGERIGRMAASFGAEVRRSLARAREEAEDIWAEAQELRRRG